jgi:hypothetical protein
MSEVKTDKLSPRTGSGTVTLGTSGDTFTIPSGVTLTNNGSSSGFDSGLASVQVFTSSGTWTRPSGITKVMVEVQAGGGSGNDSNNQNGISGSYSKKLIDVSSISTATITVGAGGASVSGSVATGNDGGLSSWSDGTNTISCDGGYGGGKLSTLSTTPIVASGGDINVNSSAFGNPIYGRMGVIQSTIPAVRDATGYGAGGGGNYSTYTGNSGAGSPGIVIVTEYK